MPQAGNGNGAQPSFHEMSAQQRAASLDAMVRQIQALSAASNLHAQRLLTAESRLDACSDANRLNAQFRGRSLSARLRWFLTGR